MAPNPFHSLRFLVVDDNAHMRRIVRTLVYGFGCREVFEAPDGGDAWEMFNQLSPDVLIIDWQIPILDGTELTKMIRHAEGHPKRHASIIMLSGYTEKPLIESARDAGIHEFLAKPISAKALHQRLQNVILNPRAFIHTNTYCGPDRRRCLMLDTVGGNVVALAGVPASSLYGSLNLPDRLQIYHEIL
jgi:two-component system chemotaxis response regulator CheY